MQGNTLIVVPEKCSRPSSLRNCVELQGQVERRHEKVLSKMADGNQEAVCRRRVVERNFTALDGGKRRYKSRRRRLALAAVRIFFFSIVALLSLIFQELFFSINRELELPLPKTLSECKGHPLYVIQRHLLKFEAFFPPDCVPMGYLPNGEAIYSRHCVHTLCSRETWTKKARTVKPKQDAYKIVKSMPKYDKVWKELKSCLFKCCILMLLMTAFRTENPRFAPGVVWKVANRSLRSTSG